jgi:cell division protein FtsN
MAGARRQIFMAFSVYLLVKVFECTVTVNSETWHRVRIGPFEGARKADEVRRMLSDNQVDTLVMKANP